LQENSSGQNQYVKGSRRGSRRLFCGLLPGRNNAEREEVPIEILACASFWRKRKNSQIFLLFLKQNFVLYGVGRLTLLVIVAIIYRVC